MWPNGLHMESFSTFIAKREQGNFHQVFTATRHHFSRRVNKQAADSLQKRLHGEPFADDETLVFTALKAEHKEEPLLL